MQINQSIINSVPVGIIGVRPAARTQDEAKRTYKADPEEPISSLRQAGRFLLKFSNVLADKLLMEASPPQSNSRDQLAAKKTRQNQSLAISSQDLDTRIFRLFRQSQTAVERNATNEVYSTAELVANRNTVFDQ